MHGAINSSGTADPSQQHQTEVWSNTVVSPLATGKMYSERSRAPAAH